MSIFLEIFSNTVNFTLLSQESFSFVNHCFARFLRTTIATFVYFPRNLISFDYTLSPEREKIHLLGREKSR